MARRGRRRARAALALGAILATGLTLAGSPVALGQLDPLPVVREPRPLAPIGEQGAEVVVDHPVARTGWARTITRGLALQSDPTPVELGGTVAPGRKVAGEIAEVRRDARGRAWAYLMYPSGERGWAPTSELRPVPARRLPSAALRDALDRYLDGIPGRIGVVVRDEYGRDFYSWGSTSPLVLASVTKLFTVGTALSRKPIGSRAAAILRPSRNDLAQRLIEEIGGGSNARGTRAAREHAASLGSRVQLSDGSGLSPRNRAAAGEVVDYLIGIREMERFHDLRRALPLSGRTGTLKRRLRGTKAEARVRAKTGTLFTPSVATLAGYAWPVRTHPGPNRVLTFAVLVNGYDYRRGRTVQDRVLRMLVSRA